MACPRASLATPSPKAPVAWRAACGPERLEWDRRDPTIWLVQLWLEPRSRFGLGGSTPGLSHSTDFTMELGPRPKHAQTVSLLFSWFQDALNAGLLSRRASPSARWSISAASSWRAVTGAAPAGAPVEPPEGPKTLLCAARRSG